MTQLLGQKRHHRVQKPQDAVQDITHNFYCVLLALIVRAVKNAL